jgi:hypothetical protein
MSIPKSFNKMSQFQNVQFRSLRLSVQDQGRRSASGGLTTPVRSARPTGQAGIHVVFRGLKFEHDADIGRKGAF